MFRRFLVISLFLIAFAAGVGWYASRQQSTTTEKTPADYEPTTREVFQAGMQAVRNGDLTTAAATWESLSHDPSAAQHAAVLRAAILVKQGDPGAALRGLSPVSPEDKLWVPAGLVRTEALYRLQDLAGAERIVAAIVRKHPDNADARRWLASIYYDLGANTAAMEHLRDLAKLAPGDFAPHHLLGQMYYDSESYRPAIDHLQQALSLDPPRIRRQIIATLLARSLLKTRQFEKALKIATDYESDASMLAIAGTANWALGRERLAREMLQRAEKIDSNSRDVLILQARMAMESGDVEDAVQLLKRRLANDPHDFECRYRLALCYRKQKKSALYQKEVTAMKKVKATKDELTRLTGLAIERPRDAEIRERIGKLFLQLGKPDLANVYRRAAAACRHSGNGGSPMSGRR